MSERTIAAISTPMGEGGIGVIRISGENAVNVAEKCFRSFSGVKLSELKGYEATYGKLLDGDNVLDDGVALLFRAPKSYTGEDVVELSAHGGRLVLKNILRAVLSAGADLAGAGEFTKRAFLNGKLDLAEAESIMGIISAENDSAYRMSRAAKDGRISREIDGITNDLLAAAASIAAFTDYPDEYEQEISEKSISSMLRTAAKKTQALLSTYDAGRLVREGINCVIAGKPNVGKSTLMNLLSGSERSIVTDIAGTTRDVIEETVILGDITLRLFDTAGIRKTDDQIENAGVLRARKKLSEADIVFAVFDSASPLGDDDLSLLNDLGDKRVIIILNKTDLPPQINREAFSGRRVVEISAKQGTGIDALTSAVEEITRISQLNINSAVLISEHQHACTQRAMNALEEAVSALESGCTLDAAGVCLDDAIAAFLELTGKRVTNEVTDEIFKRFCVGK